MSFLPTVRRFLLVLCALLLPFQPVALIAKKEVDSNAALMAKIMKHMQGPTADALAKLAVGKVPCFDTKNSIIGATERRELQIDALAKKLDKAETSFGSVALAQSLQPVAHLETILQRQTWAKALLEDESLYSDIRCSLKRIKKSEHAILAYWDRTQRENGSKLFARAEGFYYALLQIIFGEKINNNKWTLEAAMLQKMLGIGWDVGLYFGGQKLWWDYLEWQFNNKRFSPYESVMKGLKAPFVFLAPWRSELTEKIKRGDMDDPRSQCGSCGRFDCDAPEMQFSHPSRERVSASEIFAGASHMGDVAYFIQRGINSKAEIDFGKVGQAVWWTGDKINKAGEFVTDTFVPRVVKDYTPAFIKNAPGLIKKGVGHFDAEGRWVTESQAVDPDQLQGWRRRGNQAFGAIGALAWTGIRAKMFWHGIQTTYKSATNAINTMKELHIHTIHLARAINTIKETAQRLAKHPVFGTSCMVVHINKVINNSSDELQQLLTLLENDTFSTTKAKTHLFSRGNVFLAHRLMSRVYEEIVPLLQAIGELDALYAMVTNLKESAKTNLPFSFAEFVPHAQAMITIEDGWLPLVRNAVPNSISFGGDTANKIIISGPNGGGKSVFIKLLGAIVAMAQSWGIVPAKRVSMTVVDRLYSCIHPEESIEHELSTFMAEKMRVDAIKESVFSHQHNLHFKTMILLDEPFRGTVDVEQADRTYEFGTTIAPLSQSLVLIAAHVEKPTRLEKDTNGTFANYQVRIKELPNGQFEREFKLERGIPEWWFTNAQQRSRFIDFITHEKYKEQLAQMMAMKQSAAAA